MWCLYRERFGLKEMTEISHAILRGKDFYESAWVYPRDLTNAVSFQRVSDSASTHLRFVALPSQRPSKPHPLAKYYSLDRKSVV